MSAAFWSEFAREFVKGMARGASAVGFAVLALAMLSHALGRPVVVRVLDDTAIGHVFIMVIGLP